MSTDTPVYDWELDARQREMIRLLGHYPGYTRDKVAACRGRPTGCRTCRGRLAALVRGGYVAAVPTQTLVDVTVGYVLTVSGRRLLAELRERPATPGALGLEPA